MITEEIFEILENGNFRDAAEEIVKRGESLTSLFDEGNSEKHSISVCCRDLLIIADMIIDIERSK